jgi:3-methyladenine DNA glycosylase/8-oxoguanine DNA glycosylase
VVRATRTPDGPATLELSADGDELSVRAWGPGAAWATEHAGDLAGLNDDPAGFDPSSNVRLARVQRALPGLRLPRTNAVFEALVPAVLGQRVTVFEARRSFRQLVAVYGEDAPGPGGLRLPPAPGRLAGIPYYDLHQCGVEQSRADTLRRIAATAAQLEDCTSLPLDEAAARLTSIVGIGPWTAALAALSAFGDPDAMPLGDLHLPNQVAWLLAGDERADDARMLELLEPWRGHRARVVQLVMAARVQAPRRAPRARIVGIANR